MHKDDIKIWLDDERDPPDNGWTVVRNSRSFVRLVCEQWGGIEAISFDNDLGEDVWEGRHLAELIAHLFRLAGTDVQPIPKLTGHSGNPVGLQSILDRIETISRDKDRTP